MAEPDPADPLGAAEADADASFGFTAVGGVVTPCSSDPPPTVISPKKLHWIEIVMLDEARNPVAGQDFKVVLPGGQIVSGKLDSRGHARIGGIDAGVARVTFPGLNRDCWAKR